MAGGGSAAAQTFSTRSAARILAVSPDRIRYWVKRRLIHPAATEGRQYRFAFNDLLVMRLAKELLPSRHHLETIQRCFARVRGLVGPARPMTSLRLCNQDGRIVVRERGFAFEAESGQLILDFDSLAAVFAGEEEPAAKRTRPLSRSGPSAPEEALIARRMFTELLASGTRNAEVHLKIAAVLERDGETSAALKHLLSAAAIEPANAEVHERLGALYRIRSEDDNAIRSFQRALECDSARVEPHRNLAELFEQAGRRRDALRHLSAVNRLTRDT